MSLLEFIHQLHVLSSTMVHSRQLMLILGTNTIHSLAHFTESLNPWMVSIPFLATKDMQLNAEQRQAHDVHIHYSASENVGIKSIKDASMTRNEFS